MLIQLSENTKQKDQKAGSRNPGRRMMTGKRRTVQTSIQTLHKTENSVRAESSPVRGPAVEKPQHTAQIMKDQRSRGMRGSKKRNQTTDTKLRLEPQKTWQDITRESRSWVKRSVCIQQRSVWQKRNLELGRNEELTIPWRQWVYGDLSKQNLCAPNDKQDKNKNLPIRLKSRHMRLIIIILKFNGQSNTALYSYHWVN